MNITNYVPQREIKDVMKQVYQFVSTKLYRFEDKITVTLSTLETLKIPINQVLLISKFKHLTKTQTKKRKTRHSI
jgi:hypothetical protein